MNPEITVRRQHIEGFSELVGQIYTCPDNITRKAMVEKLLTRLEGWCADMLVK